MGAGGLCLVISGSLGGGSRDRGCSLSHFLASWQGFLYSGCRNRRLMNLED